MSKDVKLASEKFLEAASRNLAQSSPAISAHLMLSRCANIDKKPETVFRDGVCQRCGTIQVPGKTSETRLENVIGRAKVKKGGVLHVEGHTAPGCGGRAKIRREKWLKTSCKACWACEWSEIKKPDGSERNSLTVKTESAKTRSRGSDLPDTRPAQAPQSTTNQSSKARAKARRGGLQAMVMRSKPAGNDAGLDLMDLMQEGES